MSDTLSLLVVSNEDLLLRQIVAVLSSPSRSISATRVPSVGDVASHTEGVDLFVVDAAVGEFVGLVPLAPQGCLLVLACDPGQESFGVEAMDAGFHDYVVRDDLARLGPLIRRWRCSARKGVRLLPETDLHRAHAALLQFARSQAFHGDNIIDDLRKITEVSARALAVARASVWLYDSTRTRIRCIDLFESATGKHSDGAELLLLDHPAYFLALHQQRLIVAHDALHDPQTAEYRKNYLDPLGITSMLDAAVRQRGEFVGVICLEQVGPRRQWTIEEEVFTCAFADLVSLALESSQRQLDEVGLRQDLVRLREIYENTCDSILTFEVLTARRLVLEAFNPVAETTLSLSQADSVGRPIGEILPGEVTRVLDAALSLCLESGKPGVSELRWPTPPADRWMVATLVPSRHLGQPVHRVAIVLRDITDRKAFEKALCDREETLRRLLETTSVLPWEADYATRRFTFVGQQAERLLGYPVADWFGERFWADHIHPSDREAAELSYAKMESEYTLEYRMIGKGGGVVWIHDLVNVVVDRTGRVLLRGFMVDVTARRQAEEALRRLNVELEGRVADRTRQLEAANRELEAFSYSVSHDLRGPLRAVDGFSKALLEDYEGRLDDDGRDMLRRVRAAGQLMGELIDDLLQLSRTTRAEIRREDVDLAALARAVAEADATDHPERRVEWVIPERLVVEADPALMRVVLDNLLGNALKYSGKRDFARIELGVEGDGPTAEVFVRDNGVGYDPAYAAKLFQPFQRLHRPDEFEGHGIGLATVQRIIHRHGGRVRAEGRVDGGATIYFTLSEARATR